jgi:hypothetical protein
MNPTLSRSAVAASAALLLCAIAVAPAHASSIVFAKRDAIWVVGPNGKRPVQLTHDRKYASPSQADNGVIVALGDDNRLHRLCRCGRRLSAVSTWLGLGGGQGFGGPYRPRVSPDGTIVAYTFFHTQGLDPVTGTSQTEGNVAYTYSRRYTPPRELGIVKGWDNPAWLGNGTTMAFAPGASTINPDLTNVAYHQLGHADPGAPDDMRHAFTWFTDPAAPNMVFGDATRQGDKLAVGEDGFAATRTIRLYAVTAKPPIAPSAALPQYRCQLTAPPGKGFTSLSWSPNGRSLAYEAGGSIYVVRVGNITSACSGLSRPRLLVRGGTSPSWGPAPALGGRRRP